MGQSADTQGANQPDHDGNSQDQAKNAAKAGPAIQPNYSPSITRLGQLLALLPVRAGNNAKHGARGNGPGNPAGAIISP